MQMEWPLSLKCVGVHYWSSRFEGLRSHSGDVKQIHDAFKFLLSATLKGGSPPRRGGPLCSSSMGPIQTTR